MTIQKDIPEKGALTSDPRMIVSVIDAFEGVNPQFKRWYANTVQRRACDHLIEDHGLAMVLSVVKLLVKTNAKAYFPTITTPAQLENDWARLESKLRQEKDKATGHGRGVA